MSSHLGYEPTTERRSSDGPAETRAAAMFPLRRYLARAGGRFRRWAGGPADHAGAPFAATRNRLIATNVLVVAVVLALLSVVIYIFGVHAAQQETVAQLKYYAAAGAHTAAENDGHPPGGDSGPRRQLVAYSPSTPDIFSVVLASDGTVQFDSDQIVAFGVPVVAAAKPILEGQQTEATPIVHADGHDFQLYLTRVSQNDHLQWVVAAGISLDVQNQELSDLVRTLLIVYAVVLVLTFLTSVFLTERGLGPARLAFTRQRQFATAASHELRTPLAVIRSEAELASGLIGDSLEALRGKHINAAQLTASLEEALGESRAVTSEVDFMTRMVQDLLVLGRDASDELAHDWTIVDLRGVVENVAGKVRPLTESAGLTFDVSAASDGGAQPVWVRGDAGLLRQLMYGLLENAVRYTPSGGTIRVVVRAESHAHLLGDRRRHAEVSIDDTGVGIAPEHLANIFEPFYRAASSSLALHGEQGGTGLGLALTQWIVRAHGGSIRVHSQVGQGTTFTIELPLASGDLLRTELEQPQDASASANSTSDR
jgi:signal transduction histidine kinase